VKDDAFGWQGTDVLVMAKIGKKGKYKFKVNSLTPGQQNIIIPQDPLELTVQNAQSELHFGLYEVWSGKWKGGLEILRAIVEPK